MLADLIFEEKRQEALEKKLGCEFIRINTSKCYDEDYKIGRIETFICKFKDRESNKKNLLFFLFDSLSLNLQIKK